MRITYEGWRRDMGTHELCDLDLSSGRKRERLPWGEFAVSDEPYGVEIWWSSGDLRLSGRYSFKAHFTRRDIARMFVEAFSRETIDDVLSLLTKVGAKKSIG